jgi:hypothetical protein
MSSRITLTQEQFDRIEAQWWRDYVRRSFVALPCHAKPLPADEVLLTQIDAIIPLAAGAGARSEEGQLALAHLLLLKGKDFLATESYAAAVAEADIDVDLAAQRLLAAHVPDGKG